MLCYVFFYFVGGEVMFGNVYYVVGVFYDVDEVVFVEIIVVVGVVVVGIVV